MAQNVHHLVDSHANAYIRCKLILTEEHPALKPYDQDAWAALPDDRFGDWVARQDREDDQGNPRHGILLL